jgi:uncharacterized FlaG/YvyC family protein
MIDPVQAPTAATPAATAAITPGASTTDPSASTPSAAASPVDGAQQAATSSKTEAAAQTAQAAGSNSGSNSQAASGAAQPLRLLIEHDKSTNQYVYKLYDSSGRIVREIPQESLADAQKQAGAPGAVIDTTV